MVLKMALHGVLVKAPTSQAMAAIVLRLFRGFDGTKAKILQFLVLQLVVSRSVSTSDLGDKTLILVKVAPLQNAIFISSSALLYGAKTLVHVRAAVQASLPLILKITWVVSPLALAFANKFIPEHSWPIFFQALALVVGTCVSALMKNKNNNKRLAAQKRQVYRIIWPSHRSRTDCGDRMTGKKRIARKMDHKGTLASCHSYGLTAFVQRHQRAERVLQFFLVEDGEIKLARLGLLHTALRLGDLLVGFKAQEAR